MIGRGAAPYKGFQIKAVALFGVRTVPMVVRRDGCVFVRASHCCGSAPGVPGTEATAGGVAALARPMGCADPLSPPRNTPQPPQLSFVPLKVCLFLLRLTPEPIFAVQACRTSVGSTTSLSRPHGSSFTNGAKSTGQYTRPRSLARSMSGFRPRRWPWTCSRSGRTSIQTVR